MAQRNLPSEHGNTQDPAEPARPTNLKRAWVRIVKGVSYFSGDMTAFGKWMESKLTS